MTLRKRLLIINENSQTLKLLANALAAPDRDIESADIARGLQCVENTAYDLILAGPETMQKIRLHRPDAKIAAISSVHTPADVLLALRLGAVAYMGVDGAPEGAEELVDRALSSAPCPDDVEVLSARPQWLQLRMRCKLETAERVIQFLREMVADVSSSQRENLSIAIREILLNAIEHGAHNDPKKTVTIAFVRSSRSILFFVGDPGEGFSFQKLEHAAVSDPNGSAMERAELRERLGMRPGGFGLLITRQLVDEMIYNETGNQVLLIKYLEK